MKNFAITVKIKVNLDIQDSPESDENSEIFRNGALFTGSVSDEDFASFGIYENKWAANLNVNNTFISFKIDTGAQANILLFRMFLNLKNGPKLQPSEFWLSTYNGTNIPVKGRFILRITHGITSMPVLIYCSMMESTLKETCH